VVQNLDQVKEVIDIKKLLLQLQDIPETTVLINRVRKVDLPDTKLFSVPDLAPYIEEAINHVTNTNEVLNLLSEALVIVEQCHNPKNPRGLWFRSVSNRWTPPKTQTKASPAQKTKATKNTSVQLPDPDWPPNKASRTEILEAFKLNFSTCEDLEFAIRLTRGTFKNNPLWSEIQDELLKGGDVEKS
jgi:hypothetical protein